MSLSPEQMDHAIDMAVEQVEEHCTPSRMGKAESVDFLEGVIARLRSSIEALNEEIGNDKEEEH
jgi:hypothetical protein